MQAATWQPQQQHLGPRFLWNPKGWKPPGKLLLIGLTEHSVDCTDPRNQILSGLTTLPMFCRLCMFMTLSKHYGNEAMAQSQSPLFFPALLTARLLQLSGAVAAGRGLVVGQGSVSSKGEQRGNRVLSGERRSHGQHRFEAVCKRLLGNLTLVHYQVSQLIVLCIYIELLCQSTNQDCPMFCGTAPSSG